jgi:hypothetical protein
MTIDKPLQNGTRRFRPDILIRFVTHNIIIEIDENQHSAEGYDPICENARMMQLFLDLGSLPLVFIRFNPDSFSVPSGGKYRSCISVSANGIAKPINEWTPRFNRLVEEISKGFTKPEKELTLVYLWYNNCDQQGLSNPPVSN